MFFPLHISSRHLCSRSLSNPHSSSSFNSILTALCRNHRFRDAIVLFCSNSARCIPDGFALATAARAAGGFGEISLAQTIHSLILKIGHSSDPVVSNSLMSMYCRCGSFQDARKVFDEMPVRSIVSWNCFIMERVGSEDKEEVWRLLGQMWEGGLRMDGFTICTVLPLCGLEAGKEIHGFLVRNGVASDCYVDSCLIGMYCRCGNVVFGRRVFDKVTKMNVVIWTAMISGYTQNGQFEEALLLLRVMQVKDMIRPNKVTLLSILSTIGSYASIAQVKEVHGFAIRSGLKNETSLNNSLIDSYFKCGNLDSAEKIFGDDSWEKDCISWSSMMFGYGIHGRAIDSVALFHKMCETGVRLNHITCVGIISACSRSGLVSEGIEIYRILVERCKISPTAEICSSMVDMFCRAGQLSQALDFIKTMPMEPSPSIWGSVFSFVAAAGNREFQDLAYDFLLQSESSTSSNQVLLSNLLASSGRWDNVAEVRTMMKKEGLKKFPGCSWISINGVIHSFIIADKCHKFTVQIYEVLDNIILAMKERD